MGLEKDVIILEVTSAQKILKTTKCYCFIFVWFQVGFIRPIIKRSITFSGDLNRFNKRQIKMIQDPCGIQYTVYCTISTVFEP